MSSEKIYVLQAEVNKNTHESVVLGVYENFETMTNALNKFHKECELSHYFYDTKLLDYSAKWTNDQSCIKPMSE